MAPDRISSLCDEIFHQILSLLPIREAGRTSILSKFIESIGRSYTESIHGFRIHGILPPNHLDRWVHCLSRKGLQELVIEFDGEINEAEELHYKIHRSIFLCSILVSLNLTS
ncbi:hypothetical protein AMTRI_Chr11g94460 [Amborella trichopoda]